MCGIAGIVALDGFDPRTLLQMTQMIAHRGPNGFGFAYGNAGSSCEIIHNEERRPRNARPQIGLGNRRLAILDLSTSGNQPMVADDGALCITYNGEIYNYQEIREGLVKLGYSFVSGTDTEVVLRSYQAWGEQCLQRFNGMWSFAIWDQRRDRLFCARDRFGVKPFYYVACDRAFYFGSEIKQVLFAAGIKRTANLRALADFLEWGLQDHSEQTSFEGVCQLLGGHHLTLPFKEPLHPIVERYWDLPVEPELKLTPPEATEEFRAHFERAVRLRLRSDVPVGVSLSGGLDSSSILCETRRVSPSASLPCFSACFDDPQIDERFFISAAAAATNSATHWTSPDAESFWKSLEKIVYHQDEPVGGPSVFAQWSVMTEARKNAVPVLLGGQGGDESLCGYRKYYFFYLWHLFRKRDPALLSESLASLRNFRHTRWSTGAVGRYLPRMARNNISLAEKMGTAALREAVRQSPRVTGAGESLAERQKTDLLVTSIPKLLRHEDRNSMAHSIESRLPFLDYELVQFLVRCPPSLKLRDGWTKWILRAAMQGTLPEEIRMRKTKLGFNTPESDWLNIGLRNGHRALWQSRDLRMTSCLSAKAFRAECSRFLLQGPGALPADALFRAVSVELWATVHQVS